MKSGPDDKVWTTSNVQKPCSKQWCDNAYLNEIKPLLVLLRLFGRFPYCFEKNGTIKFHMCSFSVVYTAIFFIIQTIWTVHSLVIISKKKIAKANSYDETLYWIAISVFLFQNLIIPFTSWFEGPKVVKYVTLWKIFQDRFCSEGLKLTLRLRIRILSLLVLPAILALLWTESYLLSDMSILVFFPYISALGGSYIFILIWSLTLYEIRNMSRELSNKIITSGLKELQYGRLLWLRLSNLSSSIGDMFGQTGLSSSVVMFVTFVLSSYGLLGFLSEHLFTSSSFWGLFISASLCLSMKFVICDAAYRTSQVVGEEFSEKLLQLDLSSFPEIHNETVIFLQTMAANPPNISFFGFVTVNRNLFVSFISNTVTYLVVLLQFKASSISTEVVNATKAFL